VFHILTAALLTGALAGVTPQASPADAVPLSSGPQYGKIGQYGEVWRGGGFDSTGYDSGKYDKPLTPGKFIDPVGFAVDPADETTGTEGTALYVLDRVSPLPGEVSTGNTSWRLQKLDATGRVQGSDVFSLPADSNHYEMLGLTVDPAGTVYALVVAYDPVRAEEYTNEILGWSTTPQAAKLVAGAGLSADTLSKGEDGDPTPGVLSTAAQMSKKSGAPASVSPQGLALDVSGTTHSLAVQGIDGTSNFAGSGIAQVSTATGAITKQWSASVLDGLPNDAGESGYAPGGISTSADGSLLVLLDEQAGPSPSNIDVVDVPASLGGKPRILSSLANAAENSDQATLAVDGAAIFTGDLAPETADANGRTAATQLAAPQVVSLSNGLDAAEFEPDPAGRPDPQNPSGGSGLWTSNDPGVRLLMPEADHTLSNLAPPLASLFDTVGNPAVNSSGATDRASACSLDDKVTASAGAGAGPAPSLAAGAGGALWILTRGSDTARGTGSAFRGGRELIELAPKTGDACPVPSGTFTVAANGGTAQPASESSPLTVPVGGTVSFDASGIKYLGGARFAYEWDFGDGDETTVFGDPDPPYPWASTTASEQYTNSGSYTVTMKMFGDFGEYVESGAIEVVPSTPPTASFTSSPSDPQSGSAVSFDASSSTPSPGASLIDYSWNWGDGTIDETASASDVHAYAFPGIYTIKLIVRDSRNGVSAPATETLTVAAPPTTTTTTTPPPPTIGPPRVFTKLASLVPARGRLKIALSCSRGQTSCSGTLTLSNASGAHKPVGQASFSVLGGNAEMVSLRLSPRALATLRKKGALKVVMTIRAINPQGETGGSSRKLLLRSAKPKRHRGRSRRR
jgi:hypothetical protein